MSDNYLMKYVLVARRWTSPVGPLVAGTKAHLCDETGLASAAHDEQDANIKTLAMPHTGNPHLMTIAERDEQVE